MNGNITASKVFLDFHIMTFQESVCATFGAGVPSACVVDIGDQKTSVCCVDDGMSQTSTR